MIHYASNFMAKYKVTWKHKDLANVEFVETEEVSVDTILDAYARLKQTKPGYVIISKVEKI